MSKHPISKEFFPFTLFKPPVNEKFLNLVVTNMKAPGFIFKDKEADVIRYEVKSFDGESIEVFLISPKASDDKNAPCLIYIHGGGFIFPAAGYHYKNALLYAKEVNCKVLFVNYRLAPTYSHPVFFEDCYAAFCWAYDNAEMLGIDKSRIGIGGDSAGSTLSVGVCMMAKENKHPVKFCFQMLPYPFLDAGNNSASCKKYTDTPMWNSTLSNKIEPLLKADRSKTEAVYLSPVDADDFSFFPPAYVETAEFDCLHDDGILYTEKLRSAGIEVTLNETKGTIHGFDIAQKAPTTKAALKARISFMKKYFYL